MKTSFPLGFLVAGALFATVFLATPTAVRAAEKTRIISKRTVLFPGYVAIPMGRGRSNHMLLHTTIGGKRAVFAVDTGSPTSLIDERKAKKWGLLPPAANSGVSSQVIVNGQLTNVVMLPHLIAGGVNLGGGPMVAQKSFSNRGSYYQGRYGSVDGLIGADILNRHQAILNCHTLQLFLNTDPKYTIDLSATLRRTGYVRVPFEKNGHLFIKARLRGEDFAMVVDTGAPFTLLRRKVIQRFKLNQVASRVRMTGINLPSQTLYIVLPGDHDLTIGGIPIRNALGALAETELYKNVSSRFLGLVGADILDHYSAIIDYKTNSLWLKPPAGFSKKK